MTYKHIGLVQFPKFTGTRISMMPFVQGCPDSLPDRLSHYADCVAALVTPGGFGKIGYLTIDERHVEAGTSQRGYGAGGRTLHTEACLSKGVATWGGTATWGRRSATTLNRDVKAIIANSIDDTCMVWDAEVLDTTEDGDISTRAHEFPRSAGRMMKANEAMLIGIWTPHECIPQSVAGPRQFVRVVGDGVNGREPYFDINEKMLDKEGAEA